MGENKDDKVGRGDCREGRIEGAVGKGKELDVGGEARQPA